MSEVMTMIRNGLPPKTTITFHETIAPQFRDADFYAGILATVVGPSGTVYVTRVGDSRLESPEDDVRTPEQFRELFPDGTIPADGAPFTPDVTTTVNANDCEWTWVNNAWFTLILNDDADDDVNDDVFEAIDQAIALAARVPDSTPGPAVVEVPDQASTEVTVWTLVVRDRDGTYASTHYTEAAANADLRSNLLVDDDVTDEDLGDFIERQGVWFEITGSQMNTTLMSNQL